MCYREVEEQELEAHMAPAWVKMYCLIKSTFKVTFLVQMCTLRELEKKYFIFELDCNGLHSKGVEIHL